MKLIIDIPADVYDDIEHNKGDYINTLNWAVRNGTPVSNEGDLISRSALKEKIDFVFPYDPLADYEENIGEVMKLIDNAPTVAVNCKDCDGYEAGYSAGLKDAERPQDGWVSVNERLPEAYGEYLITDVGGNVRKDIYNDYFKKFNAEERVIAWRPLPEPYKKGGAEWNL